MLCDQCKRQAGMRFEGLARRAAEAGLQQMRGAVADVLLDADADTWHVRLAHCCAGREQPRRAAARRQAERCNVKPILQEKRC